MVLQTSMRGPFLVGVVAGLVAAISPGRALASGYLTARFGADHGSAAQANTFAVYYNPAALGGTTGTTLTGDVTAVYRYASYERTPDALSPSDPNNTKDLSYVAANTGTAKLHDILALPFIGVNTDFGTENFRAGYAVYAPYGGQANWDRVPGTPGVPGSSDGPQRWHNISGRILALYNTFAFAYRIPAARLSIGASVSPIIHSVTTIRAKNPDGSDDTVSNGSVVEGRSLVTASTVNIGAAAGVYYEPIDGLRFGLSYTSQPGFGETRMHGTLKTQLGQGQESQTDVDFLQTYPDLIRFAGAWRASPSLELRGTFEYVRWSVFKNQCIVEKGASCAVNPDGSRQANAEGQRVQLNIPRNWNDAIGFRVGPGYWITDNVELFGSYSMTTSAVPKETIDASTIDSLMLYFTLGAKFTPTPGLSIATSYTHIYYLPVDTNGANDLNISAHPISSPGGGDFNVSRSPSADGKYSSQVGLLNVNVAYTF
jgi:long-chain fatty acid transport protein